MTVLIFLVVLLLIVATVIAVKGLKIVPQSETMVIERLGRYDRTLASGVNVIWPFVEQARLIDWRTTQESADGRPVVRWQRIGRIDLREQVYDFPRQSVITRDNVLTEINALLYFQIVDPAKAVYEIANLPGAIEKLTQTTLRNVVGEMDLDETLTSRETINGKLRVILEDAAHKWGITVNRVELQDITPPADIRDAMEKQMRAERDRRAAVLGAEGAKRAAILEAEGVREADTTRAQGQKAARVLVAEGEAEALRRTAEAEAETIARISAALAGSGADPVRYLIALRYLQTLEQMVSGKDNKVVYLPYEATGVLSSLDGIRELLRTETSSNGISLG